MNLKKKLTAIACAAALMLALPTLAWADPSPEYKPEVTPGTIIGGAGAGNMSEAMKIVDFDGKITNLASLPQSASNVPADAETITTYSIEGNATNIDLEFENQYYAGQKVTLFIEYVNGGFEQQVKTVGDFWYPAHIERTGIISIVLGDFGNSYTPGTPDTPSYQPGFKHEAVGQDGQPVSATLGSFEGTVTSVSVSKQADAYASNVPGSATVLYTWEIEGDATNLDLTFQVEKEYAGQKVTVFIEHGDGAVEQKVATVGEDGTFKIHVDRLSRFSIALGDYGDSASDAVAKLDPNAKSPKTGADLGGVASATALMALAAGATFVALRRQAAK